uniref:Putative secreted protein n=1 Tax=Anopheles triannulatus TaxID=58253 RepID=A0A2M4B327_9DIPT
MLQLTLLFFLFSSSHLAPPFFSLQCAFHITLNFTHSRTHARTQGRTGTHKPTHKHIHRLCESTHARTRNNLHLSQGNANRTIV